MDPADSQTFPTVPNNGAGQNPYNPVDSHARVETPVQPIQPTPKREVDQKEAPDNTAPIKINMPPVLWKQTQELFIALEEKLGGSVVGYYTATSIVNDDVKYFYTHLESVGFREKIYFILYTSGGDGKSAYRIASLLKSYCKELIIVIPEMAASAGTMLCLAGDKIMMSPLSFLTAVDTSVLHPLNPKDSRNQPVRIELEEVRRAVEILEKSSTDTNKSEIYKLIFNYIHPVAYGNVARTSNLSEMLCKDLLKLRINPLDTKQADELIEKLNHSLPAHGYPITRDIALSMGLPVENTAPEIDRLLWKYITLNKALTEPARTDINQSHFHVENTLNIIESRGKRLSIRNTYERKLDPILKGWSTLKEKFTWEATYETEEDGKKKILVSNLNL